jgi:hypothetical protein
MNEKRVNKSQIEIGTLRQKTRIPCAFGGGNCLVSYYVDYPETDDPVELIYCLIAKQINRPWFGIEKLLRNAGCPEPRANIFGTWKCKYADGGTHEV